MKKPCFMHFWIKKYNHTLEFDGVSLYSPPSPAYFSPHRSPQHPTGYKFLFQTLDFPLLSVPRRYTKSLNFFRPVAVCECLDAKGRFTLHRILWAWKKCQIPEIQICHLPLPSAPNWHANWLNFFGPGAVGAWTKKVDSICMPDQST
jgi:hypothetical protein